MNEYFKESLQLGFELLGDMLVVSAVIVAFVVLVLGCVFLTDLAVIVVRGL